MRHKIIPSFPKYNVSENGNVRLNRHPLKLGKTKEGYSRCSLKRGGKWFTRTVHQLVAEAFIGPRPDRHDCCHNDGNPSNNHYSNLRWDTRKNNVADTYKHGRGPFGKRNGLNKLTESDILAIRKLRKGGAPVSTLAKKYGVCKSNISQITLRQTWQWLK